VREYRHRCPRVRLANGGSKRLELQGGRGTSASSPRRSSITPSGSRRSSPRFDPESTAMRTSRSVTPGAKFAAEVSVSATVSSWRACAIATVVVPVKCGAAWATCSQADARAHGNRGHW
jgi:hypothetical protein